MPISASFNPSNGELQVIGDGVANGVQIARNESGQILVNGGAVPVTGGTPTIANTSIIQTFGQGGADTIALDESFGALPRANLFGGSGDDSLTGGSGGDLLFGQSDIDTLLGKGGNDSLFGGDHDDVLTGGDGDDQMFGEDGDDRMVWNPGDDSDLMEGGEGTDTAEFNGGNGSEILSVTANVDRVRFDRIDPAPLFLDIGTSEFLVIYGNGGDDSIVAGDGLSPLIDFTIDGGSGNDTVRCGDGGNAILGGDGNDTLAAGAGADTLRGGAGEDRMNGGLGNDRFFVDDTGDQTVETNANAATGGIDTVFSTVNRTLSSNIENLRLQGSGNLNGNGNALNNNITGNAGANILKGLAGNDTIEGRDGADTIDGGEGNDTLSGGGNADVFRFATANAGVDRVLDFSKNFDRFDLSGGNFTALTTAANGDAVLTHAGGAIRIAAPPSLTLAQWNALVLPGNGKAAPNAAEDAAPPHGSADGDVPALHNLGPAPFMHADWALA